ncbi:MAG TPA: NAD(P)-dependent oxidoreductase [Verrucomicrobiae bacterium]|jgi:3-hydroxyisobutyrate dehydrogenase-like beta-hydroxyacid dehydrogenase|nr:NAD(P)-dependent oxidoreductase [Verrucomicrobiae bacterium]
MANDKPKVGFIGLGNMGIGMARNIAAAGWPLTVWNRSPEKAASLSAANVTVAKTPAAAAKGADFVATMVADDAALEAVTRGPEGLLSTLGPGAVHISMSTVSVPFTRSLGVRHANAERAFLAAPVFGRPEAAAAAKLWICAAGPAALVERCRPLLELVGQGIIHFGDAPEQASVVKLAGNFLIGSMLESLCEAFTLLRKNGIDPEPFHDLISRKLFRSPVYENYGSIALSGKFDPPAFKLALGLKDMTLALQAAQESRTPMPVLSAVHGNLLSAVARGQGDLDFASLIRVVGQNAGLGETKTR